MKNIMKRRSFLQTMSLSSMGLISGLEGISKLLGLQNTVEAKGFVKYAYRLCNFENLMNLEFYFITGNKDAIIEDKNENRLIFRYGQDEVYMVVRLPQQHISENYYENPQSTLNDGDTAQAIISGYSYLTFRFIFDKNEYQYDLDLSEKRLLEWNNPRQKLVVRQNLSSSIFEIGNTYPLGYEGLKYNPNKFPTANQTESDPAPITAIEAPSRLILSPKLPNQDIYEFNWLMNSSIIKFNDNCECIENPLWTATLKLKKREEVCIPKVETDKQKVNKGSDNFNEDEKLKIMMVGSAYDKKEDYKEFNILPRPKNLTDLVKLYTIWKLTARADKMTFSPLGITTKIDFKNTKIDETSKAGDNQRVTLIDWKQYISIGRDEQVEVSHLVIDAETGLKMVLVETSKRRLFQGNLILEYRLYLEPLEYEKDYSQFVVNNTTKNKENFSKDYSQNTFKYNIPFKKIEILEYGRKQIEDNRNNYFWAISSKSKLPVTFKYRLTHWDNTETIINKKIFVLKDRLTFNIEQNNSVKANSGDIIEDFASENFKTNFKAINNIFVQKKFEISDELDEISKEFKKINDIPNTWLKIENEFGNIARRKVDFYKDFLNKFLKNYEERFKIEEEKLFSVLGERYYNFINKKNQLKQKLILIHDLFYNKIVNKLNEISILPAIIKSQLDSLKVSFEDLDTLFNSSTRGLLKQISTEITKLLNSTSVKLSNQIRKIYQEAFEMIDKVFDLLEKTNSEIYSFINSNLKDINDFIIKGLCDLNRILNDLKQAEADIKNKIELGRQKINIVINEIERQGTQEAKEVLNKALSEFETEYIILSANFKKVIGKASGFTENTLDFFDEFASYPQLHEAKVYIKAIKDLVNEDIPVSIKIAEDYLKSQTNDFFLDVQDNASKVFAKVAEDSQEIVKGTMQKLGQEFGGIINPEIAIEYMTFLQRKSEQVAKNIQQQIEKLKNEANELIGEEKRILEERVKELEKYGADAHKIANQNIDKIKGQIDDLKKRLESTVGEEYDEIQKNINDKRAELEAEIKEIQQDLAFITEDAKEKFNKIKDWGEGQIISAQEYFKDLEAKILGQINIKDILGIDFELPRLNRKEGKIEYQFITDKLQPISLGPFSFKNYLNTNPNNTSQLLVHFGKSIRDSSYNSWTRLTNFNVGIMDSRLIVNFERLEIKSSSSEKRKVNVKLGEIEFNKELAFLKNISDAVSKLIGIPGLKVEISPAKISVGYNFAMPNISGGAFTLAKLKFFVGVNLPIPIGEGNHPISTTIGVNAPDDMFVVAVGIFGGRGFFNLTTTPKHIQNIDAAIEFGGYFGIDLAIARGEVFLMAGFRYTYSYNDKRISFTGYLICGGSVSVFGFISVCVTFYIGLVYEQFQGRSTLYGTASVSYSVRIGFFKKSFTLRYSKRFYGADDKQNDTAYILEEPKYYFAFVDENSEYFELIEQDLRLLPPIDEIKSNHQKRKENRKRRKEKVSEVNPNNLKAIFKNKEDWRQYIRSYNYF